MDTRAECTFCRISDGMAPASFVAEGERWFAIRDIAPKARVHVLVIPRTHIVDLDAFLATGDDTREMLDFVHEVAKRLGVVGRYRLIVNVGRGAGQEVPHLHWHVMAGPDLPGFGAGSHVPDPSEWT